MKVSISEMSRHIGLSVRRIQISPNDAMIMRMVKDKGDLQLNVGFEPW